MITSHMNYMLVCNAGEMKKICTGCTWLLGRMYWAYMAPQKDVLGVHGLSEGCIWNRFGNL